MSPLALLWGCHVACQESSVDKWNPCLWISWLASTLYWLHIFFCLLQSFFFFNSILFAIKLGILRIALWPKVQVCNIYSLTFHLFLYHLLLYQFSFTNFFNYLMEIMCKINAHKITISTWLFVDEQRMKFKLLWR